MKNRINDEEENKRKGRNAYKARRCMKSITAKSSRAPLSRQRGSRPRMSKVSSRIWPVKPGMRVQVWLSSRVGVLDERGDDRHKA